MALGDRVGGAGDSGEGGRQAPTQPTDAGAARGVMPVRQDAPAGGTAVSPRADTRLRATGSPVAGESSVCWLRT